VDRYAVLDGVFNAPLIAAGALAPALGTGIAATDGSYPVLFVILAAAAAGGTVLATTTPSPAGQPRPGAKSGGGGQPGREAPDAVG